MLCGWRGVCYCLVWLVSSAEWVLEVSRHCCLATTASIEPSLPYCQHHHHHHYHHHYHHPLSEYWRWAAPAWRTGRGESSSTSRWRRRWWDEDDNYLHSPLSIPLHISSCAGPWRQEKKKLPSCHIIWVSAYLLMPRVKIKFALWTWFNIGCRM